MALAQAEDFPSRHLALNSRDSAIWQAMIEDIENQQLENI